MVNKQSTRNSTSLSRKFRTNKPYKHIIIDDFLEFDLAREISKEFDSSEWISYKHFNEDKQGNNSSKFQPKIKEVLDYLNSKENINFLTKLTGFKGLIADTEFGSGGIHRSTKNGYLNIHTDFTSHPYHSNWHRRLNLIIYVTEDWDINWGGHLELWDSKMTKCVKKVQNKFNRCVVFNTTTESFHGHPTPMECPKDIYRKTIALYYYTADKITPISAGTEYKPRPQDSLITRILIKIDGQSVKLFHLLKKNFGLKDSLVTKIMELFK